MEDAIIISYQHPYRTFFAQGFAYKLLIAIVLFFIVLVVVNIFKTSPLSIQTLSFIFITLLTLWGLFQFGIYLIMLPIIWLFYKHRHMFIYNTTIAIDGKSYDIATLSAECKYFSNPKYPLYWSYLIIKHTQEKVLATFVSSINDANLLGPPCEAIVLKQKKEKLQKDYFVFLLDATLRDYIRKKELQSFLNMYYLIIFFPAAIIVIFALILI